MKFAPHSSTSMSMRRLTSSGEGAPPQVHALQPRVSCMFAPTPIQIWPDSVRMRLPSVCSQGAAASADCAVMATAIRSKEPRSLIFSISFPCRDPVSACTPPVAVGAGSRRRPRAARASQRLFERVARFESRQPFGCESIDTSERTNGFVCVAMTERSVSERRSEAASAVCIGTDVGLCRRRVIPPALATSRDSNAPPWAAHLNDHSGSSIR